ncbi:folate family ECF transporter S component [Lactococcus lactis]|uniref:folate family ECF transporter S component n=1 Tax=Lactococcus lactis TaxID=1358 RepID=UPI00288E2485|nr:folate family ECF transporter S component [Lactococcus lactis]MDT2852780.1 folate family ECF transporter S component [Lactococcus lactis]
MKTFTAKMTLKRLVILSFLLGLQILLSNLAIGNHIFRISTVFIPNVLIGLVAGPLGAAVILAFADIVGAILSGAAFFPGFTLSAFIVGILYGLFFYQRQLDLKNKRHWLIVFGAVTVIMLVDSTFFNSMWVTMMIPNADFSLFLRLVSMRSLLLLQIPLQTALIMLVVSKLQSIKSIDTLMSV